MAGLVDDPAEDALHQIAIAQPSEYQNVLANPNVHERLSIPSQDCNSDERAELLRRLILDAIPKLWDEKLRVTAATALQLKDAACITDVPHLVEMSARWGIFQTLHRRLALYQFTRTQPDTRLLRESADTLNPDDDRIKSLSSAALRYWRMARERLAELIIESAQTPGLVDGMIASIQEERASAKMSPRVGTVSLPPDDPSLPPAWKLMSGRRNFEPDWHALLGGSPLSVSHLSQPTTYIERRVWADGLEYDSVDVLAYLDTMRGRHVIFSGDLGDGKTTYLNMLAANSAETHIFVRWNRGMLPDFDSLDEYWYHTHAVESELAGVKPKTLVAVMELPGIVNTPVVEMISQSLEARSSDEIVVIIAGRPGPIRALARTGVATSRRLNLQHLNVDETRSLCTLICKAYDGVAKTKDEQTRVRHLYPYLPTFRHLPLSEQEYVLNANADGGLIVQLLSAIYGLNLRQVLVDELLNLQDADQQAYLTVCMCSVLEHGIPDNAMRRMMPDAALDERALRNPWRRVNFRHYARHQVIAQIVLEGLSEYYLLLSQTLTRIIAQIDSPDVLASVQLLAESAPYWPQFRDEQAAHDFRNCLLRALRAALADCDKLVRVVRQEGLHDRLVWGTALLKLVPRGSYTTLSVTLLRQAYDIFPSNAPGGALADRAAYGRVQAQYRLRNLIGSISLGFTESIRLRFETLSPEYQERLFFLHFKFFLLRHAIELLGREEITDPFLRDVAIEIYQDLFEVYERLRYKSISGEDVADMSYISAFAGITARNQLFEQLPRDAMSIIYDAWRGSVSLGTPNPRLINLYVRGVVSEATERNFVVPDVRKDTLVPQLVIALDFDSNYAESIFLLALLGAEVGAAADSASSFVAQSDVHKMKWLEPAYLEFARGLLSTNKFERSHHLLSAIQLCHSTIANQPRSGRLNQEFSLRFVRTDWEMAIRLLDLADRPPAEELLSQIEADISELDLSADSTSVKLTEVESGMIDVGEPFPEVNDAVDPFEVPTEKP